MATAIFASTLDNSQHSTWRIIESGHLILSGLLNGALYSSDYKPSNGRMANE
jgi:hypothetical protein